MSVLRRKIYISMIPESSNLMHCDDDNTGAGKYEVHSQKFSTSNI